MANFRRQNGGYYAIKGFTYQFDKSLLEIIANPTLDIEIEYIQDIGIDNYYIQVKHKETQTYSPSKIKYAVIQLLDDFIRDKTKNYSLFCYFKDRSSQEIKLTEDELDNILGADKDSYIIVDKKDFIQHFILEFSENFQKQFNNLIEKIKNSFHLRSIEEAALHHAIFRAHLLEIAIRKNPKERKINFQALEKYIGNKEKIIFELAYCKYLKNERYLQYLKKEYFTFSKVNIPAKERLFIIDVDSVVSNKEIMQIILNIRGRYFKKDTSPAPYICMTNIEQERLRLLKEKLWDKNFFFADGTHFNGDKFRIKDLVVDVHNNNSLVTFKFFSMENLSILLDNKDIDEIFVFSTSENDIEVTKTEQFKEFYINRTRDIIKIIQ